MKTTMTSFDVKAVLDELKENIQGKRIKNLYQLGEKLFLFRLSPGPLDLIVELERRIHTTKFKFETPLKPPHFCMELRKYLRNGIIKDILQHEFERIVLLDIKTKTDRMHLIAEIFKRGNMILLNEKGQIVTAFYFAKLRDRKILRGEEFKYPPSTGIHPDNFKLGDIKKIIKENPSLNIELAFLKIIPYPLTYIKESLLEAKIDEREGISTLDDEKLTNILTSIKGIYNKHNIDRYSPCIVKNREGKPIDVTPIPLQSYQKMPLSHFKTFNEAADEYFKDIFLELKETDHRKSFTKEEERLKRILERRKDEAANLNTKIKEYLRAAETIKEFAVQLGELTDFINKRWGNGEIRKILKIKFTIPPFNQLVESIHEINFKDKRIFIVLNDVKFWLDLKISPFKSASNYYNESKRLTAKLERVQKFIDDGKEKLELYISEVERQPIESLEKRRARKWYDKFRWFISSEELLVLLGRDAGTNQLLIDRYMTSDDLVFHAEVYGAPFTIIKEGVNRASTVTLHEAGTATASYSKAWREGIAAVDVYWIKPEQVSKKPPSGEYLRKGMYMIYGSRNYLKNINLESAVGANVSDGILTVIGGPASAMEKWSQIYIELIPGDESPGKIAKEIKRIFSRKIEDEFKTSMNKLDIVEIQRLLPPGRSKIVRVAKGGGQKLPNLST